MSSTVVFADRLNQAIDRRPSGIRTGRGRVEDFCKKFGLSQAQGSRLLNGGVFPSADVLVAIGDALQVDINWLMGRGPHDIDSHLDAQSVLVTVFSPRDPERRLSASFPAATFPRGLDPGRLVITPVSPGSRVQYVLVRVTAEPLEDANHLVFNPVTDTTSIARVNRGISTPYVQLSSTTTGTIETVAMADVDFGTIEAGTKLSIVGPVIGTLILDPKTFFS